MSNKLAIYLEQTGKTQRQLAKDIAVREATVSAWVNGGTPRPEHMKKIESATGGLVPITSWFGEAR